MKFKEVEKAIYSSDLYYNLFDGGYLEPEFYLEDKKDIQRVKEAMKVIEEYLEEAKKAGIIEEG